jgi:large subunit ribosomal protein L7A
VLENLKSSNKTVGLKQTIKALEKGIARQVFIAKDADERVTEKIIELCMNDNVQIIHVDTMKLLGKACGIDVGAAVACLMR